MKQYPTHPDEVRKGQQVRIQADNGENFSGAIAKVITRQHNFVGIKVRLDNGKIGRVVSATAEAAQRGRLEKEFLQNQHRQEGQMLEFKGSFLFDLKSYEYNRDKRIQGNNPHNIAKTIAAFANSLGGTLYIGVRDKDRQILGLKNDYDILRKYEGQKINIKMDSGEDVGFKSNGEFQTSLSKSMGKLFVNRYDYIEKTSVDIFKIEGKDLCAIKVKSSRKPVILCNRHYA